MAPTLPPLAHPLLPLLYLAWEDGQLEVRELEVLLRAVHASEAAPESLHPWLDPGYRPSPAELGALASTIRGAVQPHCGRDLVCVSRSVAERAGIDVSNGLAAALSDAEAALGGAHADAFADLFPPPVGVASWGEPPHGNQATAAALEELFWRPFAEDRRAAAEVLERLAPERRFGISTEDARARTTRWVTAIADAGLANLGFAETDPDGEVGRFIAVFETIGLFDLSLAIKAGVQFGLFGGSIAFLGNADQRARYLPDVASMALPGCFAMTERGHGSNVRDLETTATYEHESRTLVVTTPHDHARKEWIGNAAKDGKMASVFARLIVAGEDHGVHAVLVPIRDTDGTTAQRVRIRDCGEKMGLHGVDNGMLWFDDVRVPVENLLNRFGAIDADGNYSSPIASSGKRFFTMLSTLVGGRVSVGGAAISASKAALTIAVRFGARRRQFGPKGDAELPILDYPTHQRRLMPPLAECVALSFAQQELIRRYAAGDDAEYVEALAAAMKAIATRHCTATIQSCREACGGQGYAARNRFADLKADSDVFATFEGDNTVLLQLVARARLTGFKRRFDDNRVSAFIRDFLVRAASSAADRNFVASRLSSAEHLRDDKLQAELLRAREDDILHTAAGRLSKRLRRREDPFDAFKAVQTQLISLGTAWGESFVLGQVQNAARDADGEPAAVLRLVSDLYGLGRIESHLAWFMENGYVAPAKARAIRREVDLLCGELRAHAPTLVSGFGIPDALLGAPAGVLGG
jgi:acyl-CoA oxidase